MALPTRPSTPALAALGLLCASLSASAEPVRYEIDPSHTYPSFEADHMGISVWRGKFNRTEGSVTLDVPARTGRIDVTVDAASVDFGHEAMNKKARDADLFDVARFPKATYKGTLENFVNGAPTSARGELTLHGVTRPVPLKIIGFKCIPHPMFGREVCGADVTASFQRDDFGIDAGKAYGFKMDVNLRIQVEALEVKKADSP